MCCLRNQRQEAKFEDTTSLTLTRGEAAGTKEMSYKSVEEEGEDEMPWIVIARAFQSRHPTNRVEF
jgi:hypothetical protein